MPGSLYLRPIEAKITSNTDLLNKMSPYCSVNLGGQKFNSEVSKKGGKHPVWHDSITIPNANQSTLTLDVMDKDLITKDDVIGSCSINLSELQSQGLTKHWYPLFHNNKPAGEILLEAGFQGGDLGMTTGVQGNLTEKKGHVFTEQHSVVEPHTYTKNVEVVETVPVMKEVEVMEPRKVLKEVEYTETVPVKKIIDVETPQVVMKEIEVIEPKVVSKPIQVLENVPVKRTIEVIEMKSIVKEIETFEPQTFTKQVEITEWVPVKKTVQVSEPVTTTKAVEFVEPVITTQTVVKEIREPVVVSEKVTQEVGPATLLGEVETSTITQQKIEQWEDYSKLSESERRLRDEEFMKKEGWTKGLDLWRKQRMCSKHGMFECGKFGCYDTKLNKWI